MRSIRFFHTADLHFGMENYGKVDSSTGIHSRLLDFHKALNSCIDKAITEGIDLFVFAGDAYKTAYPTPTQQKLLLSSFLRLYQASIPVVIVVGNHDHPMGYGKANALDIFSQLPLDGFFVFEKPGTKKIITKNGEINVVGIPWPVKHMLLAQSATKHKDGKQLADYISSEVSNIIHLLAQELDSTIPAIMVGHLTVSNGIFSGSEKTAIIGSDPIFLPSQLAIAPFDYVALGHLHRHQNTNPHGKCPVVYSGSLEKIDFGERRDIKGFCDVKITENKICSYQFIPIMTRPMIQIDVQLDAFQDGTQKILDALGKQSIVDAIVKITYTIPQDIKDDVQHNVIQAACKEASYLAGIIPYHPPVKRTPRNTAISIQQTDLEIFTAYGKTKNVSEKKFSSILAKYQTLRDLCQNNHEEELL